MFNWWWFFLNLFIWMGEIFKRNKTRKFMKNDRIGLINQPKKDNKFDKFGETKKKLKL